MYTSTWLNMNSVYIRKSIRCLVEPRGFNSFYEEILIIGTLRKNMADRRVLIKSRIRCTISFLVLGFVKCFCGLFPK